MERDLKYYHQNKCWLPIALTQGKAGNNSKSLLNESDTLFILCINQRKSLEKYTIT